MMEVRVQRREETTSYLIGNSLTTRFLDLCSVFGALPCNSVCSSPILYLRKRRRLAGCSFASVSVSEDTTMCVYVDGLVQGQVFMIIHPNGIMDTITCLGYLDSLYVVYKVRKVRQTPFLTISLPTRSLSIYSLPL